MKKIAFYDAKSYDIDSFNSVNQKFNFEIKYYKNHLTADNVALTQGCETVCLFVNDVVSETLMALLRDQGVRVIALRCAGYNNIDLKAAKQYGLRVVRVPSYSPHAVAEHAMALILTLNRKTHKAYHRTRDGNFSIEGLLGFDLAGKTVGVIGTGQIGKVMAQILNGFGAHVLAYDVRPDLDFAKLQKIQYASLEKIYCESDIISLHCPLTKESEHMINEQSIALMKPGIMIINTGRGGLIDTKALIRGLKSKKIGSAGLDVYEEESQYFFEDFSNRVLDDDVLARLLTFNNVLLTSHQAFFTREALSHIAATTLQNIRDFMDGKNLVNEICSA